MRPQRKKISPRRRRQLRGARKIRGTQERPRLTVFFSGRYIYAQVIDDSTGRVLASSTSLGSGWDTDTPRATIAAAKVVGRIVAENAKKASITSVVFDRAGYMYHGRVKALADAAREGGLQF